MSTLRANNLESLETGRVLEIDELPSRADLAGDPADGLGAALVNGAVIRVTSIADMEAYSAPDGYVFSLNAGGRSGVFDVISGASPVTDPLKGILIEMQNGNHARRRFYGPAFINWFGAISGDGSDHSEYVQAIANLGLSAKLPDGDFNISTNVIIPDNFKISGSQNTNLTMSASFSLGMHLKAGGITAFIEPTIYYKQQHYTGTGYTRSNINIDVDKGDVLIPVSTTVDFAVGDLVYISNGYTDMWRTMESTNIDPSLYLVASCDLWKAAIHKIVSLTSSSITIESPLGFDCPVIPKTYGFTYTDGRGPENDTADAQGFNNPNVEKLIGVKNVTVENISAVSTGGTAFLQGIATENITVKNVTVNAVGNLANQLILYQTVSSVFRDMNFNGEAFQVSLRRVSTGCLIDNATVNYGKAADSGVVVWENSYGNQINNLYLSCYEGVNAVTKSIGFYLNTCRSNVCDGVYGEGLDTTVATNFYGDGNIVNNIVSKNCNISVSNFRAARFLVSNVSHTGVLNKTSAQYNFVLKSAECFDFDITNVTQVKNEDDLFGNDLGLVVYNNSTGYRLHNINIPDGHLSDISESDTSIAPEMLRGRVSNSIFKRYTLKSDNFPAAGTRSSKITESTFLDGAFIKNSNRTDFRNCKFFGTTGFLFELAPFTSFIECEFKNTVFCIDFGVNSSSTKGLINLVNCLLQAPTQLTNYIDTEFTITSGQVPAVARGGEQVDVLGQYPLIRTYKNGGTFGNVSSWTLVFESPGWI